MADSKGIKSELIPKIATGFCGGISNTDGMCGAISGGILAINIIDGRNKPYDPRESNKLKVQELISSFNNKFDYTQCYKLTGCDLGTDKGQTDYKSRNKKKLCDEFVSEATHLTLDLINR